MQERNETIKILLVGDYEEKAAFTYAGRLKNFQLPKSSHQSISTYQNSQNYIICLSGDILNEMKTAHALIYFNIKEEELAHYECLRLNTECIEIDLNAIGENIEESLDKINSLIQWHAFNKSKLVMMDNHLENSTFSLLPREVVHTIVHTHWAITSPFSFFKAKPLDLQQERAAEKNHFNSV